MPAGPKAKSVPLKRPSDVNAPAVMIAKSATSQIRGRIQSRTLFKLLGIHWGQFAEKWQLTEGAKTTESRSLAGC
jgi:hypothetical protein